VSSIGAAPVAVSFGLSPTLTHVIVHDVVMVTVVVIVKVRLINTRIAHRLGGVVVIWVAPKLTFSARESAKNCGVHAQKTHRCYTARVKR
jgi:hypothetical protein